MPDLGRLEKVDLREAWKTEAGDFTPWLAKEENIQLLGETIGIELEVEGTEKGVGPFSADILCKDTINDHWVLIENQLERTDHTHLGQLLTYAAGLEAVSIVWIAHRFTDEHRAALDWLNEITDERLNFFGLEVELWRIGDSPVAPKFNVVSKPNDWTRTIKQAAGSTELTESKQLRLEFWTEYKGFLEAANCSVKPSKPQPQSRMTHRIGRTGFYLSSVASYYDLQEEKSGQELRVELDIDHRDSLAYFEMLRGRKQEIEKAIGEPLIWHSSEAKLRRIYVRRPADLTNRDLWPEFHQWLKVRLEKFDQVFRSLIGELDVSDYAAVDQND